MTTTPQNASEQRQNASTKRGVTVLKIIKITAFNIVVGMTCGGWLYHTYRYVPLEADMLAGFCLDKDLRGQTYRKNCIDGKIAAYLGEMDAASKQTLTTMASDPGLPPRKAKAK